MVTANGAKAMKTMMRRSMLLGLTVAATLAIGSISSGVDPYGPADAKITIIVMDPMALPLACDCVQGYAQRRYEKLADHL